MKDNLWYIYDFEQRPCDECGSMANCAIWHRDKTGDFIAVCGYCDQEWKNKRILTDGSEQS
jgi:hypothetical protein